MKLIALLIMQCASTIFPCISSDMAGHHKDLITDVILKENEEAWFELYCTTVTLN
jgi:hypothetical protein